MRIVIEVWCLLCVIIVDISVYGCSLLGKCHKHASCIRRNSSEAFCACVEGFSGNGFKCTDIDECIDSRLCENGRCKNFAGGYLCECNYGFVSNRNYPKCESNGVTSYFETSEDMNLPPRIESETSTPVLHIDAMITTSNNVTQGNHDYDFDVLTDDECANIYNHTMCESWAETGTCLSHPHAVESCDKSCNACIAGTPCKDENIFLMCDYWENVGECMASKAWMSIYCRKSCKLCKAKQLLQSDQTDTDKTYLAMVYGPTAAGIALTTIIIIIIVVYKWKKKSRKQKLKIQYTFHPSYHEQEQHMYDELFDVISMHPSRSNSYESVGYAEERDIVQTPNGLASDTSNTHVNGDINNEENRDSTYFYTKSLV